MKKPSLIRITALIMIGVYLYGIVSQLSFLSKHNVISFETDSYNIMIIFFSGFGIIAGTGLYFYKNWSQLLALLISTFFIFNSLQCLLFVAFASEAPRGKPRGASLIYDSAVIRIASILFLSLTVWTLYYFTRPHMKVLFATK